MNVIHDREAPVSPSARAGRTGGEPSSSREGVAVEVDQSGEVDRAEVMSRREVWAAAYGRRLLVSDAVVVLAAVGTAHVVRFGVDPATAQVGWDRAQISIGLVLMWLAALALGRTRDARITGYGPEEYRRVASSVAHLFGFVAIFSLLLRLDPARGYLAIAFPVGLAGLVLGRHFCRLWLVRQRRAGRFTHQVLVVGSRRSAAHIGATFERDPASGYRVVAVCVPAGDVAEGETIRIRDREVPVAANCGDITAALARYDADTVAVTGAEQLGHDGMRALGWELQKTGADLVVAPGVVDVAGPRLTVRPVAGLPLMHVEEPRYEGANQLLKVGFDTLTALAALIVLSPVLLVTALLVKTTSRGPVFYRADRIGLDGAAFPMLKFRSMVDDADASLAQLSRDGAGNEVLFKMRDDPRVTRVGRTLRRLSIDELPQLINVVRGDMSLVGPRPPLPREVETYSGEVHRRLLVKPGITGLWQVSGRSDLSWDESVRLDLFYVENWSMVQDMLIIVRTVRAVLRGKGAY